MQHLKNYLLHFTPGGFSMPLDLKNLTMSGTEPKVMLIRTGAKTL